MKRLRFSDGQEFEFGPNDIVIFTGPNNAGKSQALSDIYKSIAEKQGRVVVRDANIGISGNPDEFLPHFLGHTRHLPERNIHIGHRTAIHDSVARGAWPSNLSRFVEFYCVHIPTESRITASNPFNRSGHQDDPTIHPIEVMFADDRKEKLVSNYFNRAFGEELIVDRLNLREIPLRVGDRMQPIGGQSHSTVDIRRHLDSSTKPLQTQGDGMRAFAAVTSSVLSEPTASVYLIDEPEAFLHPPQARLMGEFIATECRDRGQFFLATHSADFVYGALSANPQKVRVLRLQREGEANVVRELQTADVLRMVNDPVLRYSGVIGGVFCERAIICESYADCLFYNAILDLDSVRGIRNPDVLFLHAGGVNAVHALAHQLKALGVRVDVIVDVDIIGNPAELKRITEALSGRWDDICRRRGNRGTIDS